MSDQNSKVDTNDARKAFMAGVVTHTSPLDALEQAAETALESPESEDSESEIVAEEKVQEKQEESKPKKVHSAQERIQVLANKRKAAEQEAEAAKRENAELRARLKALETSAAPLAMPKEPQRYNFSTDQEYLEAVTDYRVDLKIAEREEAQRQAKAAAEVAEINDRYIETVEKAKSTYADFSAVVGSAKVNIPNYMVDAIKDSEIGGDITYYLAKNQDEAAKIAAMSPAKAIKYIARLENDMLATYEPVAEEPKAKISKTKAPEPITPVRGTSLASMSSASSSFEEYRAKRLAR